MREIKFRAWDNTLKKWHTDFFTVEIDFSEVRIYESGLGWITLTKEQYEGRFVIVQYTGLKDKNGKEIYDGYLIKCPEGVAEVRWFKYYWSVNIGTDIGLGEIGDCEIIGNIYENPELLK